MASSQTCILCNEPAQQGGTTDGGNRYIILCSGLCQNYEITRTANKYLLDNPHRKWAVIAKIKAIRKQNANDTPVIRMFGGDIDVITKTQQEKT